MTATAILADLITELAGTTEHRERIVQALRGTADSDTEPARDTAAARVPGDLIDLADWYLTLPTGKQGDPDTVENPSWRRSPTSSSPSTTPAKPSCSPLAATA